MDDAQITAGLRRLTVRGDWQIGPHWQPGAPVVLTYWPRGQGPGRGGGGNPFCRRAWVGTAAEVVAAALEATRPRERPIGDLTYELDRHEREHLLPRSALHALVPERWPLAGECAECGHELQRAGGWQQDDRPGLFSNQPYSFEHARVEDVNARDCLCVRRDEACWPAAQPGSQVRAPGRPGSAA